MLIINSLTTRSKSGPTLQVKMASVTPNDFFRKKARRPEEEGGSYICRRFKQRGNLWSNLCRKDLTQEHFESVEHLNLWSNLCRKDLTQEHFAPLLQSHQIFLAGRLKIQSEYEIAKVTIERCDKNCQ